MQVHKIDSTSIESGPLSNHHITSYRAVQLETLFEHCQRNAMHNYHKQADRYPRLAYDWWREWWRETMHHNTSKVNTSVYTQTSVIYAWIIMQVISELGSDCNGGKGLFSRVQTNVRVAGTHGRREVKAFIRTLTCWFNDCDVDGVARWSKRQRTRVERQDVMRR